MQCINVLGLLLAAPGESAGKGNDLQVSLGYACAAGTLSRHQSNRLQDRRRYSWNSVERNGKRGASDRRCPVLAVGPPRPDKLSAKVATNNSCAEGQSAVHAFSCSRNFRCRSATHQPPAYLSGRKGSLAATRVQYQGRSLQFRGAVACRREITEVAAAPRLCAGALHERGA
jgi:hypothetical protein